MMLDVARTDALDGQHRRGRVVRGRAFEAHWRRWQHQRVELSGPVRGPTGHAWDDVRVASRSAGPAVLDALLSHREDDVGPRPAADERCDLCQDDRRKG
jgi:hypothetical protein